MSGPGCPATQVDRQADRQADPAGIDPDHPPGRLDELVQRIIEQGHSGLCVTRVTRVQQVTHEGAGQTRAACKGG